LVHGSVETERKPHIVVNEPFAEKGAVLAVSFFPARCGAGRRYKIYE
jgi:hypothetical protein